MLPRGAYIVNKPSFAFGAPQTTSFISLPISTLQILRRSALGCFFEVNIFPTIKSSKSFSGLMMFSTSKPISVRLLVISSNEELVSKCSLSQDKVNFISLIL